MQQDRGRQNGIETLEFHLRTTVEDVLSQFAERAQRKGLEITGLVHAAVPNALRGDPGPLTTSA